MMLHIHRKNTSLYIHARFHVINFTQFQFYILPHTTTSQHLPHPAPPPTKKQIFGLFFKTKTLSKTSRVLCGLTGIMAVSGTFFIGFFPWDVYTLLHFACAINVFWGGSLPWVQVFQGSECLPVLFVFFLGGEKRGFSLWNWEKSLSYTKLGKSVLTRWYPIGPICIYSLSDSWRNVSKDWWNQRKKFFDFGTWASIPTANSFFWIKICPFKKMVNFSGPAHVLRFFVQGLKPLTREEHPVHLYFVDKTHSVGMVETWVNVTGFLWTTGERMIGCKQKPRKKTSSHEKPGCFYSFFTCLLCHGIHSEVSVSLGFVHSMYNWLMLGWRPASSWWSFHWPFHNWCVSVFSIEEALLEIEHRN